MASAYDHLTRTELIALLEQQADVPTITSANASTKPAQQHYSLFEARQTKLMMMTFAFAAYIIVLAYVAAAAQPINWLIVASAPLFSLLAWLHWHGWKPATYVTVLFGVALIGLLMPEPYVTEQVSMAVFITPVLALVLARPGSIVIAAIAPLGILLTRAQWQGAYANPVFLAIFGTLICGLLIYRRVLDFTNQQLEDLNHTLEQRIVHRTSELQHVLAELRSSENGLRIFRSAVDTAVNAMAIADLNGNMTYANLAFLQLWDTTLEQVMGQSVLKRWHDPDEVALVIATLLREGRWRGELTMLQRQGRTRILQVHANVVTDENDQSICMMASFIDITERKHDEEQLRERSLELARANQELARSARLKDEFLANMSHELRTPLTSILGRSEMLQEDIAGTLTDLQRRSLRSIEESGRHLLELINDLLDLSKIEVGKITLELQPIRIVQFCQSCLRMIAETVHHKQLVAYTVFDQNVATIQADPRRLKQILVNLLGNAAKFTPAGNEIGLEIRGNPSTKTVDLIIWDTGIGIAQVDQVKLFQPFVQIDSSLARQYEGTGLGLALVAQLTALHGGNVKLVSAPGYGSRFTITLPWEPIQNALPVPTQSEARYNVASSPSLVQQANRPLLLVLEDDLDTFTLLREYFLLHGYYVVHAHSIQEALLHSQVARPACIIIDQDSFEADDLLAMQQIRNNPTGAAIPILVFSASSVLDPSGQALISSPYAYLRKPMPLREVRSVLEQLINAVPPDQETLR